MCVWSCVDVDNRPDLGLRMIMKSQRWVDLGKEFRLWHINHVKYFAIGNPHFINKALFWCRDPCFPDVAPSGIDSWHAAYGWTTMFRLKQHPQLKFPQGMMGFFELASKESWKNSSSAGNLEVPASDKYNMPPFESTRWCIKPVKDYLKLHNSTCASQTFPIYVGPSLLRTNEVFFQASPTENTYLTFTFASTGVVGVGFFQRRLLGVLSRSEIKLTQKT